MYRELKYILVLAMFVLSPLAAGVYAQDARLRLDRLDAIEGRARDVVEVNVDGKLLDLAKRATAKVEDENARKFAAAIEGLKGIYVRVYRFSQPNEYNPADLDEVRAQLNAPGWERVANVRSKRNDQRVDVYTMFSGQLIAGIAVVVSEAKSIAIVNMIGPIDVEMLVEMSGKMNIPKMDIELSQPDKPQNKKE